jgi:hypothetical protein
MHAEPSYWLHEISLSKTVCHHFSPRLMVRAEFGGHGKQGITNTLALPMDKILYIYLLCSHSEHQKNPFQSKQSKHFHQTNPFTKCETGSNKVKLPKV